MRLIVKGIGGDRVSTQQVLNSAGWHQPRAGKRYFELDQSISASLLRIGVLTVAGVFGLSSYAEAAPSYSLFWPDSDTSYSRPVQPVPKRRHKARHHHDAKLEQQEKQAAKPQGPLIISVSIQNQRLKVYDANGLFAETPISTGMRGHPTPLGVFSVIQKHKYHRSNIYSGAPMPYMQRITWSGIAMHAGVLPGYPASHGCIRMPMSFAVKMWGWTKMGARVIVTPGEITPSNFSHPLLMAKKPAPETPVAALPATPDSAAAKADAAASPTVGSAQGELRPGIHLNDHRSADVDAGSRDAVRTADASPLPSNPAEPVVLSDAVIGANAAPRAVDEAVAGAAVPATTSPSIAADAAAGEPIAAEKAPDPVKPDVAKVDDSGAKAVASEPAKPATETASSPAAAPDLASKDQTRASDAEKPAAKAEPAAAAKPAGRIAVFVSRKDSKIYVRQNLTPLFDAPVAIAPSERPLGTHVFTAQVDKDDTFRWSVVSLPATARQADAGDRDDPVSRRRRAAGAVETRPLPLPNSAAEALDRLTIPADAMARIAEALSTGGSIVVSDQGIAAGETGEGTDFIIRLR